MKGSPVQTIKSGTRIRRGESVALRVRMIRVATVVALTMLLFAPSVEALLIPKYDFQAEIPPLSLVSTKTPGRTSAQINFTMLTGEYHGMGSLPGAYALINGESGGGVRGTEKIEVINTKDRDGAVARFTKRECQNAASCAVERTFTGGSLLIDTNSTVVFYSETTKLDHNITSPFGIGVFVNASQALKNGPLGNVTTTHSMLVVGDLVTLSGSFSEPTDSFYAVLGNPNATVRLNDTTSNQTYQGTEYLFRIYGQPTLLMQGAAVGSPFVNGTEGVFRRAGGAALQEGFRPEVLNQAARAFGGRDILLPSLAKGLRDLAPILNGVLLGRAQSPIVNEEEANASSLSIVRFARGVVVPANTSAILSTSTEFVLLGNQGFYTDKEAVDLGFMSFPPFSLLLWIVAAGAIILGFVLRPLLASAQPGAFGGIRLLGLIFHGLAFVVAAILWDQEVKNFLGTSFLTIWTDGAFGKGAILAITAGLELLSFFIASFLFGMPIRFIVNSGLKLGGLKKARGVGKGIGNLATWGLGAPFIPFVLNGFVGSIVDALQKSLGGG